MLKLCEAVRACQNHGAVEIGGKLFCVPHAVEKDLRALFRVKTPEQLRKLADVGCGELPLWARFGVPREPVQGPILKRGRGRPRRWRSRSEYWLWWSWKRRWRKGLQVRPVGRPKSGKYRDARERNKLLNREWCHRRFRAHMEQLRTLSVQEILKAWRWKAAWKNAIANASLSPEQQVGMFNAWAEQKVSIA